MSSEKGRGSRGRGKHLVRPRLVWGGLLVALVGAITIGVAVGVSSWIVAIAGILLLVLGGLVGWRGGALYDATSEFALEEAVQEVKEGDTHEGTKPGDQVRSPEAHRESLRADRTRQATTAGTLRARRPGLSVLGALLLLSGAAFVLAMQGEYPHSHTGQINGLRDLGMAVVAGLVGLLVLFSPRRHPVAAGLALLCAVGMALQAVLAPHDSSMTIGFEIAVAIAYAVGGVIALDVRRPRAGLPARGIDRTSSAVAR
jgi:hypothetical protein